MSVASVEAEITAWWHDLSGEAREEIQKTLDAAKAEEAAVAADIKAALAKAEADVEKAVEAAEPGLAGSVKTLVSELEAAVIQILARISA